jgi:hypothetical protein
MNPKLKFDKSEIKYYAECYKNKNTDSVLTTLKQNIQNRGYLTKDDLSKIAYWKAPRSSRHVSKNFDEYITEITKFAFHTKCERAKIEILTNLDGVNWPTASVILHFFDKDEYPILDFRALWSISVDVPTQYKFDFWWSYVQFCRSLADSSEVSMRILDQALWQYSKQYQKTELKLGVR